MRHPDPCSHVLASLIAGWLIIAFPVLAAEPKAVTAPAAPEKTEKAAALPFAIAGEKKLDDDALKEKKEGTFLTGLPQVSSDPVNGFGLGVDAFLYFNGPKTDPFFEYTPYRSKLSVHAFGTLKSQREVGIDYDIPYIFNSKWRFRIGGAYEDNPNLLYFGSNAATMGPLVYRGTPKSTYQSYSDAQRAIRPGDPGEAASVTDVLYNTYRKQEARLDFQFEYAMLESTLRFVVGYEVANVKMSVFDGTNSDAVDPNTGATMSTPNGTSKLTQDVQAGLARGLGYNFVTFFQLGLVYDTRDLEPDPSRGVFAELTNEVSAPVLGSNYNFNKTFLHAKYFVPILPAWFHHFVFAIRGGLEHTTGYAPFYEYQDCWSTEGSIEGLGGQHTLRGYKENRFLAPVMGYANVELRYRFTDFDIGAQHLALMLVPFFDVGRVWDRMADIGLTDWRANGGGGFRVAWNQSTVLSFDYAMSMEDQQFFFNFGHIF